MDNKNLQLLFLGSIFSVVLIPIAFLIFLIIKKDSNKKISILEKNYENLKNFNINNLDNFKNISDINSLQELYNNYDLLIKAESNIQNFQNLILDSSSLINNINGMLFFKNNPILKENWNIFFDKLEENKIKLNNIEKEKEKTYKQFKILKSN